MAPQKVGSATLQNTPQRLLRHTAVRFIAKDLRSFETELFSLPSHSDKLIIHHFWMGINNIYNNNAIGIYWNPAEELPSGKLDRWLDEGCFVKNRENGPPPKCRVVRSLSQSSKVGVL